MVFFRFPFHSSIKQVSFDNDPTVAYSTINRHIASYLGRTDFSLIYNGRVLPREGRVPRDANILIAFSLPGGKGGFGSMLRAIGAQIEKTTNREACRDLSGRRLRDINEEQRLKKWISKEGEREADKCRRRKERLERLKAKPRHHFNDTEYEKKLSEGKDRVEEALNAGMEKRSKRSAPEASCSSASQKKKYFWLDEDMSCSSDSDASSPAVEEAGGSSFAHSQQPHQESEASSDTETVVVNPPVTEKKDPKEECAESDPSLVSEKNLSSVAPAIESKEEVDPSPIDLMHFEGPTELEALGLDRLKGALTERGLKCGGSLQDRAHRLWQVRGLQPYQYPTQLRAKKKN